MRIGLIGCGRVGVTIFSILQKYHRLVGVYDTNKKREKTATRLLGIRKNPAYIELITQCQVLFIATPDDAIIKAYKKMYDHLCGTKYVFHFSGIHPAEVLPRKRGIHRASAHPFATFPDVPVCAGKSHFLLSIQGDPQAIKKARFIFSPKYFTLKKLKGKDKTRYHLIGVFSSNLIVGLIAAIRDIAGRAGWGEKEIRQFVFPIIAQTLRNIEHYGVDKTLSGPLQRGDMVTIEKHLKTLKKDKELLAIYKNLSLYILHNLVSASKKPGLKELFRD